jgi:hypothetical protein
MVQRLKRKQFSRTFWTSKSESEVLKPDRTTPNVKGYATGTPLAFDHKLRVIIVAIVSRMTGIL